MMHTPLTPEELGAFEQLREIAAARDMGPYDPARPEFQVVRLSARLVEEIRRLWELPEPADAAPSIPALRIVEFETAQDRIPA